MDSTAPIASILVVDDHPMCADALVEVLARAFAPTVRLRTAASAEAGFATLSSLDAPCIVLLDLSLPGMSGTRAIDAFRQHPGTAHVVAISGHDPYLWSSAALRAGASAFLSKTEPTATIVAVVSRLLAEPGAGGRPPPSFAQPPVPAPAAMPGAPSVPGAPDLVAIRALLTSRQAEVLSLVCEGQANKVIASALGISEQTVKVHVNQIFKVLQVSNRTQAVLKARQLGLV